MLPLIITSVKDEKDLRLLKDFMHSQAQFYPNYGDWVEGKCSERIESEEYKTIIAVSDGLIVGNSVYRFIQDNEIEIKNFRIDENYRNRNLGNFLLSQTIFEANPNKIELDVTVANFRAVEFFIRSGFKIKKKEKLYLEGQDEYLMQKTIH